LSAPLGSEGGTARAGDSRESTCGIETSGNPSAGLTGAESGCPEGV
jgi:hypothetical protein